MSHSRQWIVGLAALVVVSAAASMASAGPLRFAGRVAVRTPVAAARTAAYVAPPYRGSYYARRTYYSGSGYRPSYYNYGYRPYYYNYGYRPYYYSRPYTVARPVIYVR